MDLDLELTEVKHRGRSTAGEEQRKNRRMYILSTAAIQTRRVLRKPTYLKVHLLDVSSKGASFKVKADVKIPLKLTIQITFEGSPEFTIKSVLIHSKEVENSNYKIIGLMFIDQPKQLKDIIVRKSLLSKMEKIEIKSRPFKGTVDNRVHQFSRNRVEYTLFLREETIEVWRVNKYRESLFKKAYLREDLFGGKPMPKHLIEVAELIKLTSESVNH